MGRCYACCQENCSNWQPKCTCSCHEDNRRAVRAIQKAERRATLKAKPERKVPLRIGLILANHMSRDSNFTVMRDRNRYWVCVRRSSKRIEVVAEFKHRSHAYGFGNCLENGLI